MKHFNKNREINEGYGTFKLIDVSAIEWYKYRLVFTPYGGTEKNEIYFNEFNSIREAEEFVHGVMIY